MSENNYCVYMHTNKINGKKYVGITCRKPEVRWNSGKGYIKNQHFYSAIQKYGWDNFDHNILYQHLTKGQACEMEISLIAQLNLTDRRFGYNKNSGGSSPSPSKEVLAKMSCRCKTQWEQEDFRAKMLRRKNVKAIQVVFQNKVFKSIDEFERQYKVCAQGWLDGIDTVPESFVKGGLCKVGYDMNYQPVSAQKNCVVCEDIFYYRVKDCANFYGVKYDTMKQWLNGKRKMPKEFQEKGLRLYKEVRYLAHPQKIKF